MIFEVIHEEVADLTFELSAPFNKKYFTKDSLIGIIKERCPSLSQFFSKGHLIPGVTGALMRNGLYLSRERMSIDGIQQWVYVVKRLGIRSNDFGYSDTEVPEKPFADFTL